MNAKSLTSSKETPYFICSVIISAFIYLFAMFSIIGIVIALVILAFVLFSNAIMLGSVRGNGVRVSEKQFPDIYERVTYLSGKMELKNVPDVFVIHSEGAFNAFATRFFGRNMVVIYSEVFELAREQGEKELDFIIAHELSHIKRRHIWKSILTLPANFIPFLAEAYSRACEYTCDREAAYYIEDGAAAKRALTILSIGKGLYKEVNDVAYLEQIHTDSDAAVWFAETLSTHPILPKRIQAVGQFMEVEGTPHFEPNVGKIAIGAIISGVALFALYIGIVITIVFSAGFLAKFLPSDDTEIFEPTLTPLMDSVVNSDITEVEALLDEGADIHETDEDSTTALLYAVYYDEFDIAQLLLDEGANPNDIDYFSHTLTAALANESYDLAALLYHSGADPTLEDPNGETALDYLGVETVQEFKDLLKEY